MQKEMVLEGKAKADVELCAWRSHFCACAGVICQMGIKWRRANELTPGNAPCQRTGLAGHQGYWTARGCIIETVEMKPNQGKTPLLRPGVEPADLRQKTPVLARGGPTTVHVDKGSSKHMIPFG